MVHRGRPVAAHRAVRSLPSDPWSERPAQPGDRRMESRTSEQGSARMRWIRTTLAVVVGVVALVCLLCSVIGFWARNTLFDETKVASAAETALDDPAVTDALAVRLTDRVMTA